MTYWDTNTITVWEMTGRDPYGQPSFSSPRLVDAVWKDTGDTQKDDEGVEFVPASTFFTLEELQRGWYIAKGDQTAVPNPSDAEAQIIRKVTEFDMSQFSEPTEYMVMT